MPVMNSVESVIVCDEKLEYYSVTYVDICSV